MSKALLRGELDKEFKELESPENSKKAFKTIEKSESEQLPTDCHGVKKAKKRIKLKSNSPFVGAELAIKAGRAGYRIGEIGIHTYPRTFGTGTSVSFKNILLTLKDMTLLFFKI